MRMMTPEAIAIESTFRIVDKDGVDRDFHLNGAQRQIDENLTGRDLIPKARQRGVTSFVLARYTAACMLNRNESIAVISHETDATQRALARIHYYLQNLRGPKPELKNVSQNLITFPKTNSKIFIGTAGSKAFGRGDTITRLLCTEYAFWPDQENLLLGLLQSVPASGEIAIESTGNGAGDDYHKRCLRAWEGSSRWKCHFLPWQEEPEYSLDLTPEEEQRFMSKLDPRLEEDYLAEFLTPGQLAWRRMKLEEIDFNLNKFKQEYPMSFEECFQASGRGIFHRVLYKPTLAWEQVEVNYWKLAPHPLPNGRYVLGVDVASGTGQNRSVIDVYSIDDDEQVAQYVNDRIGPDALARQVIRIGKHFNGAYVNVENNNHGILTLHELRREGEWGQPAYPDHLLFKHTYSDPADEVPEILKYGFKTTKTTKPFAIGKLRKRVSSDVTIHSSITKGEMDTYVEDENGNMAAQKGCYDDCVSAAAMAMVAWEEADTIVFPVQEEQMDAQLNPLSLEGAIKELTKDRRASDVGRRSYHSER